MRHQRTYHVSMLGNNSLYKSGGHKRSASERAEEALMGSLSQLLRSAVTVQKLASGTGDVWAPSARVGHLRLPQSFHCS